MYGISAPLTDKPSKSLFLSIPQIEGRDVRPGAYTTTDVASYYNLWKQGLRLADVCLGNFGLPGFIVAGQWENKKALEKPDFSEPESKI